MKKTVFLFCVLLFFLLFFSPLALAVSDGQDGQITVRARVEEARKQGLNEEKAERYFIKEAQKTVSGEKEKDDDFYRRVKEMLLSEGETSNAIGRLTDKEYFETLTYEEKQRYTLSLSEKYLRALERFRKESEFAVTNASARL